MNLRQSRSASQAAVLLALALALSACSTAFDLLPEKVGGLPASAPQRPAEPVAFPNVYEVRPTREAKPLNDDEQKKLESELATLREAQKQRANPPPPPPKAVAAAPAKKASAKAPVKSPAKTSMKTSIKTSAKTPVESVVPEKQGPTPLKPIN